MGLKQKTFTGFVWTSAGTLGNGIISLIVTMIMSRILTPKDFALIALLNVFLAISNVLVDSGFSQAIIRDDNPSDKDLSSVFYFNILLSLIIYAVLYLLAPKISVFYKAPELTSLSRAIFFVIIFNSFSLIQNATLNRNLNFGALNKSSVLGSLFAGIISIVMAFTDFGIWALIANSVFLPFFRSILLWYYSKWRPIKCFSISSIKRYLGFGGFLMIQGLLDTIVTNLTSLIMGRVYTKNDLAYYSQGGKLNSYIVTPLSSIMSRVTYPIFATIKNEHDRLKKGYIKILGLTIYITLPITLFILFNAEDTMVFFFGRQWIKSGIYFQLFSVFGFFYLIQKVCMNIVMVKGKTKTMLFIAIIKHSIRLIAILATLKISVLALASANIITSVIASSMYIGLGMYYLKYNLKQFFLDNYKTFITAFVSIILMYFVGFLFIDLNLFCTLLINGLVLLSSYLLISKTFKIIYLQELVSVVTPLIKKIVKK